MERKRWRSDFSQELTQNHPQWKIWKKKKFKLFNDSMINPITTCQRWLELSILSWHHSKLFICLLMSYNINSGR